MTLSDIQKKLKQLKFPLDALNDYQAPNRHFYKLSYIEQCLNLLYKLSSFNECIFLATVYQYANFDAKNINSTASTNLFIQHSQNANISEQTKQSVLEVLNNLQMALPKDPLALQIRTIEIQILSETLEKFIPLEHNNFKEFQFKSIDQYKKDRIEQLQLYHKIVNLNPMIEYVKTFKPKVGFYAGSFNPFHKGHYNILQKAEQIFDKVIIACGQNIDKKSKAYVLPKLVQNREFIHYQSFLTDVMAAQNYPVTLVRGLRDAKDFEYETIQLRCLQQEAPSISCVYIISDAEFAHYSSSGIRTLEVYKKQKPYLLE